MGGFGPWPGQANSGPGGGVQTVTGPSVDNTDPANPVVNNPFDLYLSFGHGTPAVANTLPTPEELIGGGFWLSPTTDADNATIAQVREWVTTRALRFLELVVRVDASSLNGTGGDIVVTVGGAETTIRITIPAGVTNDTTFTASGAAIVPSGSKVGVKWAPSATFTAGTLRTEVHLRATESSGAPAVLPAGLVAQYETDPAINSPIVKDGGNNVASWTDAIAAFVVSQADNAKKPVWFDAIFNAFPGVRFGTATSQGFVLQHTGANLISAGPRTVMVVAKFINQVGGTFVNFRETATYFACDMWNPAGTQFGYDNGVANNVAFTAPVDYTGVPVIIVWNFDGTDLRVSVNNIPRTQSNTNVGPEGGVTPGFDLGNNIPNDDRNCLSYMGGAWVWGHSLSDADESAAVGYAAKYLP